MLGTGMILLGGWSALTFADRVGVTALASAAKVTSRVITAVAVVLYIVGRFMPGLIQF